MSFPLFQVDAFATGPFTGNPAAVCLLEAPQPDEWMQAVAQEMNLSETAFLVPESEGYNLRWFTPAVEVDLCGHATLASAHVLWETGRLAPESRAVFSSRSGILTADRIGDLIQLDFPAKAAEEAVPPNHLLSSLGLETGAVRYAGRNAFDYLIEVDHADIVLSLSPDYAALSTIPVRGTIVTSRHTEYDFISRFFAPAAGVNEDPVTGSAHCCLAPYWAERIGKNNMTGFQASKRGGIVHVEVIGDRVKLGGTAVTVFKGELVG